MKLQEKLSYEAAELERVGATAELAKVKRLIKGLAKAQRKLTAKKEGDNTGEVKNKLEEVLDKSSVLQHTRHMLSRTLRGYHLHKMWLKGVPYYLVESSIKPSTVSPLRCLHELLTLEEKEFWKVERWVNAKRPKETAVAEIVAEEGEATVPGEAPTAA